MRIDLWGFSLILQRSGQDPVLKALDKISADIEALTEGVSTMASGIEVLQEAVRNENTVIDSAITLIGDLAAQLKTLAYDPSAILALAREINDKKDALAAALVANTPAATPDPGPGDEVPIGLPVSPA